MDTIMSTEPVLTKTLSPAVAGVAMTLVMSPVALLKDASQSVTYTVTSLPLRR